MIERYEKIIKAALEIQQLRYELAKQKRELAQHITLSELKRGAFYNDLAEKALKLVSDLKIEESRYVTAKAIYKDVEISLHAKLDGNGGGKAIMTKILEAIKANDLFENA